ncbi:MAG: oligoribonuclease [Betaproteobacteria bacterium]|jgi:oligoribonuclease|nr:oligoribonuclease [Betaproteobacteria bacterium]
MTDSFYASGTPAADPMPAAAPPIPAADDRLVWIDLEMTGLKPDSDRIIEVALVVTDASLATIAEAPVWVVHQSDATLAGMDSWNQGTHGRSGLIDKVKASTMDEATVEAAALAFLREHVPAKGSPMCGNSICQDRRFLARWMPALEDHFHYRNLDVSTLKELARRWQPEVAKAFAKESKHTALADVYESIEEMKHYRQHFLRVGPA